MFTAFARVAAIDVGFYAQCGLLLAVAGFVVLLAGLFLRRQRAIHDRARYLPLEDSRILFPRGGARAAAQRAGHGGETPR